MEIFSEREFNSISVEELNQHIGSGLNEPNSKKPAFTLLIGAGFSTPLIPTTREMVKSDIAWWLFCRNRPELLPFCYAPLSSLDFREFTSGLWEDIYEACDRSFPLDGGFPDLTTAENIGRAYQAAMSAKSIHGLFTSQLRRQYICDVGKRAENKVNGAHLYLASILQGQETWRIGGPFCKTIFTTNFDSLLQRSLQLIGKFYYMTDSPDLLESPEDDSEAIHLVYCHGSVHRHLQLNTHQEIESARESKAHHLIPYLERHGVIVLGHSGWRDVIIEALLRCRTFAGNLYWCDIHPVAEAKARLNETVLTLLRAHRGRAFYVPIEGADAALFSLHRSMELGNAPQFAIDPMKQMIHNLKSIDLSKAVMTPPPTIDTLPKVIERTLQRLKAAKQFFDDPEILNSRDPLSDETAEIVERALIAKRMNGAFLAADNWKAAVSFWTAVIKDQGAIPEERADALFNRGTTYLEQRSPKLVAKAIKDFTAVINMPEAALSQKAEALVSRGMGLMDLDKCNPAIKNYTAVVDLPGASAEIIAQALLRRAIIYWMLRSKDDQERIKHPKLRRENLEKAIADFTAIIEMTDVSQELRASALCKRGKCFDFKDDLDAAYRDFATVIDWQDVSTLSRARAIASRGEVRYRQDRENFKDLIADSAMALKLAPSLNDVRLNLGLGLLLEGDAETALTEYTRAHNVPLKRLYTSALENIQTELDDGRIMKTEEVQLILSILQERLKEAV